MTTAPKPAAVAPKKRRTQAERRAATQEALLDATIDCLVEDGYAKTTTTRIVERAGVSRGAQVHHFPTKAELVAEAVRHLARRRATELAEEVSALEDAPARLEAVLDLMWRTHVGQLFTASIELFVAARTDADLRERMVEVERDTTKLIYSLAQGLFPERARDRQFRAALDTALAAIRGLAVLNFIEPVDERRWRALKRQLLAMAA